MDDALGALARELLHGHDALAELGEGVDEEGERLGRPQGTSTRSSPALDDLAPM